MYIFYIRVCIYIYIIYIYHIESSSAQKKSHFSEGAVSNKTTEADVQAWPGGFMVDITNYCGWLLNPASPKGWLKPKQNNAMFTTYQRVQDFFHPQ